MLLRELAKYHNLVPMSLFLKQTLPDNKKVVHSKNYMRMRLIYNFLPLPFLSPWL